MKRFLIDADIAIYAMKNIRGVLEAMSSNADAELVISSLAYSQLLQGVPGAPDPRRERTRIASFITAVKVAPYDRDAAHHYGRIVETLGIVRRNIVDRMIAAHALSLQATLVTNNIRDFEQISDLTIANWAEPT